MKFPYKPFALQPLLLVFSLLIVALGQPQKSPALSLVASSVGFALFWAFLLKIDSKKRRFLLATSWFTLAQLIQLSWLASPTYQGIYTYFLWFFLALWLGAQFGLVSLLLPKRPPIVCSKAFALAGVMTLLEWSRLFVFCGFAWNPVGLCLSANVVSAQSAAFFGVFGLSFWVIFVNAVAINLFYVNTPSRVALFVLAALAPYIGGAIHLRYHSQKMAAVDKRPFNVALVQLALLPDQKQMWKGRIDQFVPPFAQWERVISCLEKALSHRAKDGLLLNQKLDLIALPEAAVLFEAYRCVYPYEDVISQLARDWDMPTTALKHLALKRLVSPFAKNLDGQWFVSNAFWAQMLADHYQAEVVIGLDSCEKPKKTAYNAAFYFLPSGNQVKRYEKQILLPVVEYLPFPPLRSLAARYGISAFFTPGKDAKVFGEKCPFSISICYEECFGHLMRKGRKKGAKLFVNLTNDGWYPNSRLPREHFAHSYLRTIENGVSLVRACNTGVTVAVDSVGRIRGQLQGRCGEVENIHGAIITSVPLYTYTTLYTLWGDYCVIAVALISALYRPLKRLGWFSIFCFHKRR